MTEQAAVDELISEAAVGWFNDNARPLPLPLASPTPPGSLPLESRFDVAS